LSLLPEQLTCDYHSIQDPPQIAYDIHRIDLTHYLLAKHDNVYVHEGCRRDYQYIRAQQSKRPADTDASSESSGRAKFLRSSTDSFDWKTMCFLCGKPAVRDKKHPDRCDVHEANSDEITQSMLSLCDDRNDDWAFELKGCCHVGIYMQQMQFIMLGVSVVCTWCVC